MRATTFTTLYNFSAAPANPTGSLISDINGNFNATAETGGGGSANNCGAILKISSTGALTVLYAFSGDEGCLPSGALVRDSSGNFYGTTLQGGAHGYGVIFKLDGSTFSLTTLHSFTSSDGASPNGSLIFDSSGDLIGTTYSGGTGGRGTIFKLNSSNVLSTLWSFHNGTTSDGDYPAAGVIADSAGNLYGTTSSGGANSQGTIYEYTSSGGVSPLYTFAGSDGTNSTASLIRDSSGTLYGTTRDGGGTNKYGVVFSLTTGGTITYTKLHAFDGTNGGSPRAEVLVDGSGNIFGTTYIGGTYNEGVIYKLTSGGTYTVLCNLGSLVGANPVSAPVLDSSGNMYITTQLGPAFGAGSITKLDSSNNLSVFSGMSNSTSSFPAGITRDSFGNIIGVAWFGGNDGAGGLYRLNTSNQLSVLHHFTVTDGAQPNGPPFIDSSGNLFGAAQAGGGNADTICNFQGCGTAFEYSSSGHFTVLHYFGTGGISLDGDISLGAVTADGSGNVFGTTVFGGSNNDGTIYKISAGGTFSVLHSFASSEGDQGNAGVILDSSGNVYTTPGGGGAHGLGSIVKLDTSNSLTVLYSFGTAPNDGSGPGECLVRDSSGNMYGTTQRGGGSADDGIVWKYDNNKTYSILHSFSDSEGQMPIGFLVRDASGNLYGVAQNEGTYECGTVWKLDTSNNVTVLHTFDLADGCNPIVGVIFDGSGNLYGTTSAGGSGGGGTIFKIVP